MDQSALMLERIVRLETAISYERAMTTRQHLDLDRRLCRLERRMGEPATPPPIGTTGWIKIAIAIMLPLLVLAATGSPQQAAQMSLRMMGVTP